MLINKRQKKPDCYLWLVTIGLLLIRLDQFSVNETEQFMPKF